MATRIGDPASVMVALCITTSVRKRMSVGSSGRRKSVMMGRRSDTRTDVVNQRGRRGRGHAFAEEGDNGTEDEEHKEGRSAAVREDSFVGS
jgi:hypothetical protein